MSPKYISTISALLALAAVTGGASAQTIPIPEEVNQVIGDVEFSNSLAGPISSLYVWSSSIGLVQTMGANTWGTVTPTPAKYDITVLADGTTHNITPRVYLDSGNDQYHFATQVSPPVPNEITAVANEPQVDFSECAGSVSIEFYHHVTLAPFAVPSMSAYAYPEVSPGSFGGWQAYGSSGSTVEESFAVRGDGSNYRIDISYSISGFSVPVNEYRVVNCNEEAEPIKIYVDPERPPWNPGAIEGYVDLRYLTEQANTTMSAWGGIGSGNSDTLASPHYGDFLIDPLAPSDYLGGSAPWWVSASMYFNTGVNNESFTTVGHQVFVPSGTTVSTGNAFIMDASYANGDIDIRTPIHCANAANLVRRRVNGSRGGEGSTDLAFTVGPDRFAQGGMREIESNYLLAVGTPNNDPDHWTPYYHGTFGSTGGIYQSSNYTLRDDARGSLYLPPSPIPQPANVDHCLAYVNAHISLNNLQSGGSTFYNPRVSFSGGLTGDGVSYYVDGGGSGTPLDYATRAVQGDVPMCVPAGTYTFSASVNGVSGNDVISDTALRPVTRPIACGAIVNPLVVEANPAPACKGADAAPLEAKAYGLFAPAEVESMFYTVNCTEDDLEQCTWIQFCGDGHATTPVCGTDNWDPTVFSIPIDTAGLARCSNTIRVKAIDVETHGNSYSGPSNFAVEDVPTPGPGCNDVTTGPDGIVHIDDVIDPMNSCGMDIESVFCRMGSVTSNGNDVPIPGGAFASSCRVRTACGISTCYFTATH